MISVSLYSILEIVTRGQILSADLPLFCLSRHLTDTGRSYTVPIDHYKPALPVVAFKFSESFKKEFPRIKQSAIQHGLRQNNWIVPNYELPPNAQNEEVSLLSHTLAPPYQKKKADSRFLPV